MSTNTIAVVVSYQPDLTRLIENLKLIKQQVDEVVLVDNASSQQQAILDRCKEFASVIPTHKNAGIGAAHNLGIEYAKMQSATHIMLFDQDSQPTPNMVATLHEALASEQLTKQKISAVGPRYADSSKMARSSFFVRFGWLKFKRCYCEAGECYVAADFLISSGSLMPTESLDAIGLMDESLFIDHVDTEWFFRAKSKDYQAYGVCDAQMEHGLGEDTRKLKLPWGERNVPVHKPFRYYYMFRNSVLLYKRQYASKKWVWNDLQRLAQMFVFFGVLSPHRKDNLPMIFKGIRDGFASKTGVLNLNKNDS